MARTSNCLIVIDSLPKELEQTKMETSFEIYLKDYRMPDYYFDTINFLNLLDCISLELAIVLQILFFNLIFMCIYGTI